jgi:hypothetical protein
MKSRKDEKVVRGRETGRSTYAAPEIVSLSSADLLELLGPAQGYGSGTGSGTSVSEDPSGIGFKKV